MGLQSVSILKDGWPKKWGILFVMYIGCSVYPGGIWIGAFPPHHRTKHGCGCIFLLWLFHMQLSILLLAALCLRAFPLSVKKRCFTQVTDTMTYYDDHLHRRTTTFG